MFYFYVFYRVHTNIPKLFGLVVYYFMDFLGDNVACARFGTKIQESFFSHTLVEKIEKSINLLSVCKLYPTLLALLSHTASSVAYEG